MAIPWFLALTREEFGVVPPSAPIAWMDCHFSAGGTGLANLPPALPAGSLLILSDRIPPAGHDPLQICRQLALAVDSLGCSGLLLDFQRQGSPETKSLAALLVKKLPCPVAVSQGYAGDLDCPVFLSPCPHHVPLSRHIAPWKGRRLWLDLARDAERITLTREGAKIHPIPPEGFPEKGYPEPALHCHYAISTEPDAAHFTLWRSREDLEALAENAETLGVEALVGLYCELQI